MVLHSKFYLNFYTKSQNCEVLALGDFFMASHLSGRFFSIFLSHLRLWTRRSHKFLSVLFQCCRILNSSEDRFLIKKKIEQCRNCMGRIAIWQFKNLKFHSFRPSDTRIKSSQVFPPSATKYMPPGQPLRKMAPNLITV